MTKAMPSVQSFGGRRVRYETARSFKDLLVALRAAMGDATQGQLGTAVRECATRELFEQRMREVAAIAASCCFLKWTTVHG